MKFTGGLKTPALGYTYFKICSNQTKVANENNSKKYYYSFMQVVG